MVGLQKKIAVALDIPTGGKSNGKPNKETRDLVTRLEEKNENLDDF